MSADDQVETSTTSAPQRPSLSEPRSSDGAARLREIIRRAKAVAPAMPAPPADAPRPPSHWADGDDQGEE